MSASNADLPNECWQSDVTHWRLADGSHSEILTWLDDHARYALSVHIGIGRAHARRPIVMLIDDLDIRVIDTTTGQVLRPLTLDPTRNYQPRRQ